MTTTKCGPACPCVGCMIDREKARDAGLYEFLLNFSEGNSDAD